MISDAYPQEQAGNPRLPPVRICFNHEAQIPAVRAAGRAFLERAGYGGPDQRDNAMRVLSELVTNAVRHAPPPGLLVLTADTRYVEVAVHDPSPTSPHASLAPPNGDHATEGRGWHLVTSLASPIRISPDRDGGKTIHAHLSCR